MKPSEKIRTLLAKEGFLVTQDMVEKLVDSLSAAPGDDLQKEFLEQALPRVLPKYRSLLGLHSTALQVLELVYVAPQLPVGVSLSQRPYSDQGLWLEVAGVKAGELDFVLNLKNNGKYTRTVSQLEVLLNLSKENLKVVFPEKTEAEFCYRMGIELLKLENIKGLELNLDRFKEVESIKEAYKKIENILMKKNYKFHYKESIWERKIGVSVPIGVGDLEIDSELYQSDDSYNIETYNQHGKTYFCIVLNTPNLNWAEIEERIDKILA